MKQQMNEHWKYCLEREEVDSFSVATDDIILKSEETIAILFLKEQLLCTRNYEATSSSF